MAALQLEKFSHVALYVSDINQSMAFYRDVLGLETIFEIELADGVGFSTGFVTPAGVSIELIQVIGLEVNVAANTSTLAFSVADLDTAKASLVSTGVEIVGEMEFDGVKMLFIKDPDGHNIEIVSFPGGISSAAEMHAAR